MYRAAIALVLLSSCSFNGSVSVSASDASPPDADAEVIHSYVSYWSFDVDATDLMGAHNGALVGGAAITTGGQGYLGDALQLSEEGDRVDVANPLAFDFNVDFTWHFYMKTSEDSGALLSRSPPNADWNEGSKAIFVRNGRVQFDSYNVGNPDTGVDIDDDIWHQVIVTFRASDDVLKIYVDPSAGSPSPDYDETFNSNRYDEHTHEHRGDLAGSGFSMGDGNSTGGLGSLDTMIGLMDEVAVFSRVIEGAELVQLIDSGPSSF
jgi:hypothetical protein